MGVSGSPRSAAASPGPAAAAEAARPEGEPGAEPCWLAAVAALELAEAEVEGEGSEAAYAEARTDPAAGARARDSNLQARAFIEETLRSGWAGAAHAGAGRSAHVGTGACWAVASAEWPRRCWRRPLLHPAAAALPPPRRRPARRCRRAPAGSAPAARRCPPARAAGSPPAGLLEGLQSRALPPCYPALIATLYCPLAASGSAERESSPSPSDHALAHREQCAIRRIWAIKFSHLAAIMEQGESLKRPERGGGEHSTKHTQKCEGVSRR